MTIRTLLRWRNEDKSADINDRAQTVFNKGFVSGGTVATSATLNTTVSSFIALSNDGAVVRSDASESITIADGVKNYIVLRARYRLFDSPIQQVEVLSAAAYGADPELAWLVVVATIDFSLGGPHATIAAADIDYTERNVVDPQGRTFWRDPVATFGVLPSAIPHSNRHGDVRMTLDTRSLYSWDQTLGLWLQLNEAALNAHRDEEHCNGIVMPSSSTSTLLPTVAGTNINIAGVPLGSAYTVDGLRLTGPAGATSIGAATVGTSEGLIQVSVNSLGVVSANYRLEYAAAPNIANVAVVGISDNHAAAAGLILHFDSASGGLQWNGGEYVIPSGVGRYRLYRPAYDQWVEVQVYGALPGVDQSDSTVVNATTKTDSTFLIAHYRWDGAATLELGEDKRVYGNLDYPQLADDFKTGEFWPRWDELRGGMVYSGGACSVISGFDLRVTGPLVAYVAGQRFVSPVTWAGQNGYTGITMPASTTTYLYVDADGVLQVSGTDPTTVTGLEFAEVASVVTNGGGISSIVDRRDPQLIVGSATRNARVRYTASASARWQEANKRLVVEDTAGGAEPTTLEAGGFRSATGAYFAPTTAMNFTDANGVIAGTVTLTNGLPTITGSGTLFLTRIQAGSQIRVLSQSGGAAPEEAAVYTVQSVASDTSATLTSNYTGVTGSGKTIAKIWRLTSPSLQLSMGTFLPGHSDPSFAALFYETQLGNVRGLGVDDSAGAGLALSFLANSVTVGTGSLRDFTLRRVSVNSAVTIDTTALANGVYVVAWDQTANFAAGGFSVISAGTAEWRRHVVLGFLQKSGGVNTAVTDCAIHSAGHSAQLGFTVGQDPAGSGLDQLANFRSLRAALLFRCAYASTPYIPRRFIIVDDIVEATPIDFASWEFSGLPGDRLDGMSVVGLISGSALERVRVSWGTAAVASTVPLIDFQYEVNSVSFENVIFRYLGDPGAADCCWLKDPAANLVAKNCSWESVGGSALTSLTVYDSTTTIGGSSSEYIGPTVFENCQFLDCVYGASAMFVLGASTVAGRLAFENCQIYGSVNGVNDIITIINAAAAVDVDFHNCVVGGFDTTLINTGAAAYAGKLALTNCRLIPNSNAQVGSFYDIDLTNCDIADDISLVGARNVVNCRAVASAVVTGGDYLNIVDCDFATDSTFTGPVASIRGSKLYLGTGGLLTTPSGVSSLRIDDSSITKNNASPLSATIISVGASDTLYIRGSTVAWYGAPAGANLDPMISASGSTWDIRISGSTLGGLRNATVIDLTTTSGGYLSVSDCVIAGGNVDAISVYKSAGSADSGIVKITDSQFTMFGSSISSVIEVFAASTAQTYRLADIRGNSFKADMPPFFVTHTRSVICADNIAESTVTSGGYAITLGSALTTQESVLFNNNTFITTGSVASPSSASVTVNITSFKRTSMQNNTFQNRNTGTGMAQIIATVFSNYSGSVIVKGNTLRTEANNTAATASANSHLLVNGTGGSEFDEVLVDDNVVDAYTLSLGAAAVNARISVTQSWTTSIQDNILSADGATNSITLTLSTLPGSALGIVYGNTIRPHGGTYTFTNGAATRRGVTAGLTTADENLADV